MIKTFLQPTFPTRSSLSQLQDKTLVTFLKTKKQKQRTKNNKLVHNEHIKYYRNVDGTEIVFNHVWNH